MIRSPIAGRSFRQGHSPLWQALSELKMAALVLYSRLNTVSKAECIF